METLSYEVRRWLVPLLLGIALTLALLLALSIHDGRAVTVDAPNPAPTLMPTPPIVIPAGSEVLTAAPQIAREERDGAVTITITNNTTIVDTDICVALICPPREP